MASLACLLYDLGSEVAGSDKEEDFGFEDGLKERKIKCFLFNENNIKSEYTYIISNAYGDENIEVQRIKELNCKYYYYHEFISTLPGIHIAVSGTHGKTTTTKMIVDMLKDEKIAYIIGDGTGGATKNYKYLIYEACEYKDHFLSYKPDMLVVNKVDFDHPDYFNSIDEVYSSFEKLIKQSKIVISKENNGFKKQSKIITYGINDGNYTYNILEESDKGFKIEIKGQDEVKLELPFFGYHMIDNFMNTYIVLRILGYDVDFIKSKIKNIRLPKRRMEEEVFKDSIIVTDYAHHPTEIKALYDGLRQKYPGKEMIVFFQPHTYSRTLALANSFVKSLDCFDEVYIFPTFSSARENKDSSLEKQVKKVFEKYKNINDLSEVAIEKTPKIYIFLGAGVIHKQLGRLKKSLS